MRVIRKDRTSVELGYNRDPGAGRYEIFVLNPNFSRRSVPCNDDKCLFTEMQPGTTYNIWLGTSSSWNPVRCVGRAKPLVVTATPAGKCVCLGYFSAIQKHCLKLSIQNRSHCYHRTEWRHHQFHRWGHATRWKSWHSLLQCWNELWSWLQHSCRWRSFTLSFDWIRASHVL